jgi:hypothetical protein
MFYISLIEELLEMKETTDTAGVGCMNQHSH